MQGAVVGALTERFTVPPKRMANTAERACPASQAGSQVPPGPLSGHFTGLHTPTQRIGETCGCDARSSRPSGQAALRADPNRGAAAPLRQAPGPDPRTWGPQDLAIPANWLWALSGYGILRRGAGEVVQTLGWGSYVCMVGICRVDAALARSGTATSGPSGWLVREDVGQGRGVLS